MINDPLFYVVAIPAVVLFGLSKGGFSGVSALGTPLMAIVVAPTRAAAILLPVLLVQDALALIMFRRKWDRQIIARMVPGAAIGIGAAFLLAKAVPQAGVAIALGSISIIFSIFPSTPATERPREPSANLLSPPFALLSGAASGFASTIAHAGVPPFQFYALSKGLQREVYIGTSVVFFAAINYMKVVPFLMLGQLTLSDLLGSALLIPVALISTWAGAKLAMRVDATKFFSLIRFLMAVSGIVLIIEGLSSLQAGATAS